MKATGFLACFCVLFAATLAQLPQPAGRPGIGITHPRPRVCRNGRLFAGSVNDTLAEHLHSTGIYERIPNILLHGRPVFSHTTHQQYMYYMKANVFGGYWAIGPNLDEMDDVTFIAQSLALHPSRIRQGEWYARYRNLRGDRSWTLAQHFQVHCVQSDFKSCDSGRIRLDGFSKYSGMQERRAGIYQLENVTHQLRPVYRHVDESGDELEDYMFYTSGMWMVGPIVGSPMASMFVADFAMKPEYIMESWALISGTLGLVYDDGVTIACEESVPPVVSGPPSFGNESYIYEEEEGGTEGSEESETEISSPTDNVTRPLPDVICGDPPVVENANLTKITGYHYLDLAFYTCQDGFYLEGSSGVVCDHNGEWSEIPQCIATINTPTVPFRRGSSRLHKLLRRARE